MKGGECHAIDSKRLSEKYDMMPFQCGVASLTKPICLRRSLHWIHKRGGRVMKESIECVYSV